MVTGGKGKEKMGESSAKVPPRSLRIAPSDDEPTMQQRYAQPNPLPPRQLGQQRAERTLQVIAGVEHLCLCPNQCL